MTEKSLTPEVLHPAAVQSIAHYHGVDVHRTLPPQLPLTGG